MLSICQLLIKTQTFMDHVRWQSASLLFAPVDILTSTSEGAMAERYKYDMAQAEQMSKKLSNPASIPPSTSASASKDVDLGLQGLEDAERLVRKGSLEEGLKLYELAIELLLKCLRSTSNSNHDFIAKRVTVALSEAEALKGRIAKQRKSPATTLSPTSANTWSNLSASLSSAISGSASSPSPTKQSTNQQSPTKEVSRASTKPAAKQQPAERKRTRLDYDKDPLVQKVKADLYVDPSELQQTTWQDIAGLARAKQSLQESAILPLIRPDLFSGLRKAQNILLYGPPGTGKTMLVKAVAHESKCLLFSCSASTLTSKWHGEGEKLVRCLFQVARDVAPSLIFVDEMDSLLSSRSDQDHEASRRFKTEFMVQMDGITSNANSDNPNSLLVVGCTNCPWNVDDAILRRFPRRILIPLPDAEARKVLLQKLLEKAGRHSLTKRQVSLLVKRLDGFSGSDISAVASEASFGPIRSIGMEALQNVKEQQLRPISLEDFEAAISQSTKSVSPALLQRYDEWEAQQQAK
jgi:SpoVK/Ycf46/Vps4 family AAA+-type ATPase